MMTNKEAKDLLAEIAESDHTFELNDWEKNFIESVSEWVNKGGLPSDKQEEKIRQIHEKMTQPPDDRDYKGEQWY